MTTQELPNLATFLSALDARMKDFQSVVMQGRMELAQMASDAMLLTYEERDELAVGDKTEAVLRELMADDLANVKKGLLRLDLKPLSDAVGRAAHMANRDPDRPLGVHPSNRPQSDD